MTQKLIQNICNYCVLWLTTGAFLLGCVNPVGAQFLPAAGQRISLSQSLEVPVLRGIKVYAQNPFRFDFVLDQGSKITDNSVSKEKALNCHRLIQYFLASLTTPERNLWVNLSPYEKERIIPDAFGQTYMGRDLLAQDYLLKQITASLLYPKDSVGKKFWEKVYAKVHEKYGTTDVPLDTFNKVWIVPEKAVVFEKSSPNLGQMTAFVTQTHLKVMLESDYVSLDHAVISKADAFSAAPLAIQELTKQIVREVVVPLLEEEVNQGANFASLRQIYFSLVLAAWYKRKVKDSLLKRIYVDQDKVSGVNTDDPHVAEKIWVQYVEAFKQGVFNFVQEEQDILSNELIPRKYFAGGVDFDAAELDQAMTFTQDPLGLPADFSQMIVVEAGLKRGQKEQGPSKSGIEGDDQRAPFSKDELLPVAGREFKIEEVYDVSYDGKIKFYAVGVDIHTGSKVVLQQFGDVRAEDMEALQELGKLQRVVKLEGIQHLGKNKNIVVTEYLPGTFRDLVAGLKASRANLGIALNNALALAKDLLVLEENGIDHGDLQHQNVRLASDGAWKMIDLGDSAKIPDVQGLASLLYAVVTGDILQREFLVNYGGVVWSIYEPGQNVPSGVFSQMPDYLNIPQALSDLIADGLFGKISLGDFVGRLQAVTDGLDNAMTPEMAALLEKFNAAGASPFKEGELFTASDGRTYFIFVTGSSGNNEGISHYAVGRETNKENDSVIRKTNNNFVITEFAAESKEFQQRMNEEKFRKMFDHIRNKQSDEKARVGTILDGVRATLLNAVLGDNLPKKMMDRIKNVELIVSDDVPTYAAIFYQGDFGFQSPVLMVNAGFARWALDTSVAQLKYVLGHELGHLLLEYVDQYARTLPKEKEEVLGIELLSEIENRADIVGVASKGEGDISNIFDQIPSEVTRKIEENKKRFGVDKDDPIFDVHKEKGDRKLYLQSIINVYPYTGTDSQKSKFISEKLRAPWPGVGPGVIEKALSDYNNQPELISRVEDKVDFKKGGIDLNPVDQKLQVNSRGQEVKFTIDPALLERYRDTTGFDPVILNMKPLNNLPQFLGAGSS